jgi:DNA-binding response OmpR family regulator
MRALVVEDSLPIRAAIRDGLAEQGFAVDVASNGEDGLWLAEQNPYDIVVLDIMLPLIDGLEVLRRLRQKGSKVAVLLLTARDTLVRRRYDAKDPVLRVDDLVIDTVKRRVKRAEAVIALSPREYALLEYLAMRAGELVTRTDIWEHVYDFRSDAQSNVVDVYVSYLRKKLGPPSLIHTRRGQGYVLGGEA